uniref:Uncharacterized protein n=1 Tax=Ditylum brightwellii TaxID=49249 RepID=A0A7S1VZ10_9STRA|mmetsp:Transcript_10729/g.15977  ORF Transcript_10729/g.15977 Transcript_10729/m.15977 type:complete len:103 (+) Transcript_10729:146-454(+)
MVVHALKSTAVRGTRAAVAASQKRSMGGSSAPAPEWTGIDAVVRKYLPQDDQRKCFFVFVCRCWGEIHGDYLWIVIFYRLDACFGGVEECRFCDENVVFATR